LVEQLEEKKHQFYLIKKEAETIGFLSISSKDKSVFFLHKFYINSENAHSGIGTMVLNELEKMIKPNQISLTVNRENYKSINFYFKNGFKIESVQNFDIGNGFEMNDFVMVKTFD
jgi:ribosomal protein S18 acetylase RimI-like enzyme